MATIHQLKLSEAWERAGREAGLWDAWLDWNAQIDAAEKKYPPLPGSRDELIKLFGSEWRTRRRAHEEQRDSVIGPLTNRRAHIREEINDVLREHMINLHWSATGRPDDPLAHEAEIDSESWHYFDLGAVSENCLIYPRYFRRNEVRRFIYHVKVVPSVAQEVHEKDLPLASLRKLVLAIDKQMIPEATVFSRQADLIREINHHLALSLQASARELNLTAELRSLSHDNRIALLQHFLRMVMPELGSDLLAKMAKEIVERKLLSESMDRLSSKSLEDIASQTLLRRIKHDTSLRPSPVEG